MKGVFIFLILSVSFIFSGALVSADEIEDLYYISSASVNYDARYFPGFFYDEGGAEGHSGAYVQINVGVVHYGELSKVNIKAKHIDSDFEVTLREAHQECAGGYPSGWNVDQYWGIRLKPEDWMAGTWEITLKYRDVYGDKDYETVEVYVDRFSYPPQPTGLQFAAPGGRKRIIWNSIGVPGVPGYDGEYIEYRIMHHVEYPDGIFCIDQAINIRDASAMIPLNRIRQTIPEEWESGDLIRVENRVYKGDGSRYDRGVRYFYLP